MARGHHRRFPPGVVPQNQYCRHLRGHRFQCRSDLHQNRQDTVRVGTQRRCLAQIRVPCFPTFVGYAYCQNSRPVQVPIGGYKRSCDSRCILRATCVEWPLMVLVPSLPGGFRVSHNDQFSFHTSRPRNGPEFRTSKVLGSPSSNSLS